jgi:hypothetical protein
MHRVIFLANSAVSIQFTIVNAAGSEEYQEQHNTRTDRYGMINLVIEQESKQAVIIL